MGAGLTRGRATARGGRRKGNTIGRSVLYIQSPQRQRGLDVVIWARAEAFAAGKRQHPYLHHEYWEVAKSDTGERYGVAASRRFAWISERGH